MKWIKVSSLDEIKGISMINYHWRNPVSNAPLSVGGAYTMLQKGICVEWLDESEEQPSDAVAFLKWMKENDTPERAEEWFHYSDEDMYRAFKEEQLKLRQ